MRAPSRASETVSVPMWHWRCTVRRRKGTRRHVRRDAAMGRMPSLGPQAGRSDLAPSAGLQLTATRLRVDADARAAASASRRGRGSGGGVPPQAGHSGPVAAPVAQPGRGRVELTPRPPPARWRRAGPAPCARWTAGRLVRLVPQHLAVAEVHELQPSRHLAGHAPPRQRVEAHLEHRLRLEAGARAATRLVVDDADLAGRGAVDPVDEARAPRTTPPAGRTRPTSRACGSRRVGSSMAK